LICKEKKIKLPPWLKESKKYLSKFSGLSKEMKKLQVDVLAYTKELTGFIKVVLTDYKTSKQLIQSAKSLDDVINYRKKINGKAKKHRKKIKKFINRKKLLLKRMDRVKRASQGRGILVKIFHEVQIRQKNWMKEIKDTEKGLGRYQFKSMLHGVD